MQRPDRKAILIAGMHRSGTSALAKALTLAGVDAGNDLLPAVKGDNEAGYWELREVVNINNACLEHFGLTWQSCEPMPTHWLSDPWLDEWKRNAASIIENEFKSSDFFLIKDPRLSRLLPAWRAVLDSMAVSSHVIVAIRHPLEVAASLLTRPNIEITARDVHLLRLRYLVDAEAGSRGSSRGWVLYPQLLDSGERTLAQLAQQMKLAWPTDQTIIRASLNEHLDRSLRHQLFKREIVPDNDPVIELSCRVYKDIATAMDSGRDPGPILSAVAEELEHLVAEHAHQAAEKAPVQPAGSITENAVSWAPQEFLRLQSHLYFRGANEAYTACHSVTVEAYVDEDDLVAEFTLPPDASLEFLRFDPASMAGVYRLETVLADGNDLDLRKTCIGAVRRQTLPPAKAELVRIVCTDDDPWIELDVREYKLSGVRNLTFRFRRESILDQVREPLEQQLQVLAKEQQQLKAATRTLEQKSAETLELSRRVHQAAATTSLAWISEHTPKSHRGIRMTISNVKHLAVSAQLPGIEEKIWSVNGSDSGFELNLPPSHQQLPAGWYVMSVLLGSMGKPLHNPKLYLDHGDGFTEKNAIPLALGEGTYRHRLLLKLDNPVYAMRLDPTDSAKTCDLVFSSPSLQRINRAEAMLRLGWPAIKRMRMQGATWLQVAREMWTSIHRGPSKALDTLHTNAHIATGTYNGPDYQEWIAAYDTLDDNDRAEIDRSIQAMRNPPRFSIVLPVYNTPEQWLQACIDSVLAQRYPHWELCIANDASTQAHVEKVLDAYAKRDPRIKLVHRPVNGHISAASNSALELATCEWTILLDHDDELAEHALYQVAVAVIAKPDAHLIYSDEDKLDSNGRRCDPYFKPDWNPELLLGQNTICHLAAYRTHLVRHLGGFREGFEGSQDYDLALRCVEQLSPDQIVHIPKVLYHWRAVPGSTALATSEKSYITDSSLTAITECLNRRGLHDARVSATDDGYYRVRYALPTPAPKASLIIPTRDRVDLLRMSVGSILEKTDYPDYEIIIVDNQSVEPATLEWFAKITKRDDRVRVLPYDAPFNFSRINNTAVAAARGDLVCLVNNDIEIIHEDWLTEMASHAVREGIGAVGAKLYFPDGTIQHAGVILGIGGVAGHAYLNKPHDHAGQMGRAKLVQNLSAVTAACLMVKKSAYLEVGGMNEDLEIAFNDIDFCLRLLNAGYRNLWTPYAELIHHESASRGYEDTPEKQVRFAGEIARMRELWGDLLDHDPAYNCNLSLRGEAFCLATPPRSTERSFE